MDSLLLKLQRFGITAISVDRQVEITIMVESLCLDMIDEKRKEKVFGQAFSNEDSIIFIEKIIELIESVTELEREFLHTAIGEAMELVSDRSICEILSKYQIILCEMVKKIPYDSKTVKKNICKKEHELRVSKFLEMKAEIQREYDELERIRWKQAKEAKRIDRALFG